jgi:DNA uptake protein ComE-like DNA-binding protein
MKILKSRFGYDRRQRNGILFLLLIIIGLQLLFFYSDFPVDNSIDVSESRIVAFQKEMDSLRTIELERKKYKRNPFNPNFITDYKGYLLGMSTVEIDKLHAFRKKNDYINSTKQFQEVTGIGDSVLLTISPYFKFPEWVTSKNKETTNDSVDIRNGILHKGDINLIDFADLIAIEGVGVNLANRILNYRARIQGFSMNDQLYEVWYLEEDVAERILQSFEVMKHPDIQKLNINKATFKQVLSIVYIDYELTRKIFNYRDEVAEIQDIEELKKIDGFPLDKFNRIALYLVAE